MVEKIRVHSGKNMCIGQQKMCLPNRIKVAKILSCYYVMTDSAVR